MEQPEFEVGDVVTRMGDDRQLVLSVGGYNDITVECFVEPKDRWISTGERETNLAGRYQLVCRDHEWIDITSMIDKVPRRKCGKCAVEQELVVR
ncbi:MAG TPA: hypothetical protein VNH53_03690 [Sphingomicrobium sp.]|jgi:hypothetical protein|nr:hypothetical protein [Sphingomicrobium sp.]